MWLKRSAPSRALRTSSLPLSSLRRARARSCGGCSATWPRAGPWAIPPRSRIPASCPSSSSITTRETRALDAKILRWGYWFGGALCFLGLVSLSLGIAPLLGLKNRLAFVQAPGQETVNLKLAGGYLAFCAAQGLKAEDARRIPELQFSLTDGAGREVPI